MLRKQCLTPIHHAPENPPTWQKQNGPTNHFYKNLNKCPRKENGTHTSLVLTFHSWAPLLTKHRVKNVPKGFFCEKRLLEWCAFTVERKLTTSAITHNLWIRWSGHLGPACLIFIRKVFFLVLYMVFLREQKTEMFQYIFVIGVEATLDVRCNGDGFGLAENSIFYYYFLFRLLHLHSIPKRTFKLEQKVAVS